MANITTKIIDQQQIWEEFITLHPEANFLQSWYWGEFHEQLGHQIIRSGFYESDNLVGLNLAVVEPAKRGRHLAIPGGPILNWNNQQLITTWVNEIGQLAKQHNCLFVRVRPQLLNTSEAVQLFKTLGFKTAPMHLHAQLTSKLDLSKDDDELKKAMRKGTRYEINRSIKLGIKVEATNEPKLLDEFYNLQIQTAKRQKFVPFSYKFLTEQFKLFAKADKVLMYRSTYQGKLLAMAFIIFYNGEAAYHYGASTDLARQYPGAYAIQWEAIHEAKRRGCRLYDFWGITEHGQTKHRFYGASVFKRGFGGQDVAYLPARDLVVNPIKYQATYLFETARRKVRHL